MPTPPNHRYSVRNFIKGKIGEIVFEEMFRKAGQYTVLPFGYERTLPVLAQYSHLAEYKPVLENVRRAPDFILVSNDKTRVYLVEVKYRRNLDETDWVELARTVKETWPVTWLFVATPDGFYFDSFTNIIKNEGKLAELNTGWVDEKTQKEFREVLGEFIQS